MKGSSNFMAESDFRQYYSPTPKDPSKSILFCLSPLSLPPRQWCYLPCGLLIPLPLPWLQASHPLPANRPPLPLLPPHTHLLPESFYWDRSLTLFPGLQISNDLPFPVGRNLNKTAWAFQTVPTSLTRLICIPFLLPYVRTGQTFHCCPKSIMALHSFSPLRRLWSLSTGPSSPAPPSKLFIFKDPNQTLSFYGAFPIIHRASWCVDSMLHYHFVHVCPQEHPPWYIRTKFTSLYWTSSIGVVSFCLTSFCLD